MPNARAWFYSQSFNGRIEAVKPNAKEPELTYCDHCEQPCQEPSGNPDRAQFCCLCVEHEDVCATCEARKEKR
jgi:hypothetical protein